MITIGNCRTCYEELEEVKEDLGDLWVEMCEKANDDGFLNLICETTLGNELWIMENLNYIVSREASYCTQVKLMGRSNFGKIVLYCTDRERHHD